MWLIVSSLSPYNLYLLFYCDLSIFALFIIIIINIIIIIIIIIIVILSQFILVLWQSPDICQSFFAFFYFHSVICWNGEIH